MINVSVKVSNYLVELGVAQKNKVSILRYGLELIWTSLIGVFFLVLISVFLGKPWAWIFFLMGYVPLRKTAGGYHAATKMHCYIISTLAFTICLLASVYIKPDAVHPFLWTSVSSVILWVLSPVEANNKPLRMDVRKKNRKISLQIVCGYMILAVIIWIIDILSFNILMLYLGMLVASMFLVIGKIDTLRIHKLEKKGHHYEQKR